MKKWLSIFIVALLLIGAVPTVVAAERESIFDSKGFSALLDEYTEKEYGFKGFLRENDPSFERTLPSGRTLRRYKGLEIFREEENFAVFAVTDYWCTCGYETVYGYTFENGNFCTKPFENKAGFCVYSDGSLYTLKEAVDNGIKTIEELADIAFAEPAKEPSTFTIPATPTQSTTAPQVTEPSEIIEPEPIDDAGQWAETEPTESKSNLESIPRIVLETKPTAPVIVYTEATEPKTEVTSPSTEATEATEKETNLETMPQLITEPKPTAPVILFTEATEAQTTEPSTAQITEHRDDETVTVITTCPVKIPAKIKKSANPIKLTIKKTSVKKSKKSLVLKPVKVKNAKGAVSFKKLSGTRKITVSKNGTFTVRKSTGRGTYTLRVQITAKGDERFKKKAITKTVKIKIS